MVLQLFIGGVLIGLTVCFHALMLDLLIKNLKTIENWLFKNLKALRKALFFTFVVLCVALILIVEIWAWALLYWGFNAFPDLEQCLYFFNRCFYNGRIWRCCTSRSMAIAWCYRGNKRLPDLWVVNCFHIRDCVKYL